ncbi:hypothetical protein HAX54_008838 [Datura stramonium]|uniref:Uncharacterized protein n=1 Tax=Datura stramonium TaxID=4076 RepID=A0ABS8TFD0_DATST|nr:hypothetical protein [Datura stramonium]
MAAKLIKLRRLLLIRTTTKVCRLERYGSEKGKNRKEGNDVGEGLVGGGLTGAVTERREKGATSWAARVRAPWHGGVRVVASNR